jgi:hypothetical protein
LEKDKKEVDGGRSDDIYKNLDENAINESSSDEGYN